MSNNIGCLKQSSNTIKGKGKLSKSILVVLYLVIWSISLAVFWLFTDESDALGYGIMFLWVIIPLITLGLSVLIGKNGYWGKMKWFSPLVFGMMYMLIEYTTFSTANMISFGKLNSLDFMMILYGGIISAIGLMIGLGINHFKSNNQR